VRFTIMFIRSGFSSAIFALTLVSLVAVGCSKDPAEDDAAYGAGSGIGSSEFDTGASQQRRLRRARKGA